VNRTDPTGQSSILNGPGYFGEGGGGFPQPPWESARSTDLGYNPYQPLTQGPPRGPETIRLRSGPTAPTVGQGTPRSEPQGSARAESGGLIANSANDAMWVSWVSQHWHAIDASETFNASTA